VQIKLSDVLTKLGITRNYKGYNYLFYAMQLILNNPDRLLLITKWLYPDVAKHFETTPCSVERNLRAVTQMAWERNPHLLKKIARRELERAPTVSKMLSYLLVYLDDESGKFDDHVA
jgi:hypothetical protein